LRPAVEVGLIINAWAMVNQGAGLAIVDPHSAYGALFPDIVRRPFSPAVPVALEVLHAEARPLSRVAANFVSFLERNVSDVGPRAADGRLGGTGDTTIEVRALRLRSLIHSGAGDPKAEARS
jgi:hypothetical protein